MSKKYNKIVYGGDVLIDLTQDTIKAEYLKKGETAHTADGETIEGAADVKYIEETKELLVPSWALEVSNG